MRAARFHRHGGPGVLGVDETDRPGLATGEVLVEVAATSVNPVDTYFREGGYAPPSLPFTPGVDVAGTVIDPGDGDAFAAGDRVMGTGIGGAEYQGAYAEYAAVPRDRLVPLPDAVDFRQAAAAPVAGVTSWRALVHHADIAPTESCLVHGGSGGIGHAAVQIAATAGATVIATAAPEYHDAVRSLGADTVLDYGRGDLADAVRDAAGGGVDVVYDHRLDDYFQFDAEVAAPFGRVIGLGEHDDAVGFTDDSPARSKELTYQFMSMFNTPDLRVPLRAVATLLARGDLEIHVERVYGLEAAGEAQRAVMEDSFLGKLVIEP